MKHLTVGVFHDDEICRDLGKKNTESDIAMFSRKLDECIFTFMHPVEDKLSAKSQIISSMDAAVVNFAGITRELGETLVMLDALGISNGIAVTSPYANSDQISAFTKNTALESFIIGKRDPIRILEVLKNFQPSRDTTSATIVVVDHSFSVKGVGEVILGFVKKGTVKKYDKLMLLPANKEVLVRSIQMQDEDYDEAQAGSRVGLAIKGVTAQEMKRGSLLCEADVAKTTADLDLSFKKSQFYSDDVREGAFHATVGMQTVPITISEAGSSSIKFTSDKPVAYTDDDIFLILDLNAKKGRIMGKASTQAL